VCTTSWPPKRREVGKLYVPSKTRTPVDRVRELLSQAETEVSSLRGAGREALQLLHEFDQIEEHLNQLEQRNADVRVERTNFETVQRQLHDRKRRFLREAGEVLQEERERAEPARSRWWWYLDEVAARQRRRTLLRMGGGAAAVLALLAVVWLAYKRFLAPPPEVGLAFRQMEAGREQVTNGDLGGAIAAFEEATELTPDDPEPWLWKGVVHDQLDEADEAREAFDAARRLYGTPFDFTLNRGRVYLQAGDVEQAQTDVETAIELNPDSGWSYYLRAGIAVRNGKFGAALADLDRAATLAHENGDAQLEALASTQRAGVMKLRPGPTSAP
jgi:Flp pilus assembly protein TadD